VTTVNTNHALRFLGKWSSPQSLTIGGGSLSGCWGNLTTVPKGLIWMQYQAVEM